MPALDIKDSNCTQCSMSAFCNKPMQVNLLNDYSQLMIIGANPDDVNENMDSVMRGGCYDFMRDVMKAAFNPDFNRIHFTYLVKCNPKGNQIDKEHIQACMEYLNQEIEFVKPKAIVILGKFVAEHMGFGDDYTNLLSNNYHELDFGGTTIPTFITYSPKFVDYQRKYTTYFAKTIYDAYSLATDKEATEVDTQVEIVTTHEQFDKVLELCVEANVCSWDFEANGKLNRRYDPNLFFATGLAISFQQGSGYFIPLQQFDSPIPEHRRKSWTMEVLSKFKSRIIQNPNMLIVGQNLKFDFHVLANYVGCFDVLADYDDTMYIDFYLDNTRKHGLKEMVTRYYPQYGGYEDEIKKYKWDSIPLDKLAKYACVDSDMTLRLKTILEIELLKDTNSYRVYKNITIAAAKNTFKAECKGMDVDNKFLQDAIKDVTAMIKSIEDKVMKMPKVLRFERYNRMQQDKKDIAILNEKLAKWMSNHKAGTKTEMRYREQLAAIKAGIKTNHKPFNLSSTAQLTKFLYEPEGLFLKKVKDPNTKQMGKTGVSTLMLLDDTSGFTQLLLEYRSLTKTLGTYLEGIFKRLDSTSRIHADFKVTGTDTGRIACKDPNLMNITNAYKQKFESAKKAVKYIKSMFKAPKGHHIIQVDYSQAELRCIAYYAQCKYMLDAYANDIDLHAQTAADVMGLSLDEFYKLDEDAQQLNRQRAKAVNFGFIYGMSAESFKVYAKEDYGVDFTLQECIHIRNVFFEKRPELLVYHDTYKGRAKHFGYVRTLFGSRRILPDINSDSTFKQGNAERQAINTPIQGSSGQMTIFAINLLEQRLDPRVQFINTVHDSILYYIPNDILDSQLRIIKHTCENLPIADYFTRSFEEKGMQSVKMKVDVEVSSDSWATLKKYKFSAA